MNKQNIAWEKIFATNVSDKDLYEQKNWIGHITEIWSGYIRRTKSKREESPVWVFEVLSHQI